MFFVARNGKLYKESKHFVKACFEIVGVTHTELWRDAYEIQDRGDNVLVPAEVWPYEIVDHKEQEQIFRVDGGIRIDFYYLY